jgi:hypothetical protein
MAHRVQSNSLCSAAGSNSVPFINGKFYANPAYGRALENARIADLVGRNDTPVEVAQVAAKTRQPEPTPQGDDGHWVTIAGHHVFIHEGQAD